MTTIEQLSQKYSERFKGRSPQVTPAIFSRMIVASLHAMMDGTADSHQQKKLLEWIINGASRANAMHYADNMRDSDFSMGRAFVGQQMLELLKISRMSLPPDTTPPENLKTETNQEEGIDL